MDLWTFGDLEKKNEMLKKLYVIISTLILLLFSGCVSRPTPIPEIYQNYRLVDQKVFKQSLSKEQKKEIGIEIGSPNVQSISQEETQLASATLYTNIKTSIFAYIAPGELSISQDAKNKLVVSWWGYKIWAFNQQTGQTFLVSSVSVWAHIINKDTNTIALVAKSYGAAGPTPPGALQLDTLVGGQANRIAKSFAAFLRGEPSQ